MEHFANNEIQTETEVLANTSEIKTSDVYNVDKNIPNRFNNPECFKGYR